MKHAHISFRSKPIWISDDERKSAVYEATIPQPFLEAFDPFAGGFGVVRLRLRQSERLQAVRWIAS